MATKTSHKKKPQTKKKATYSSKAKASANTRKNVSKQKSTRSTAKSGRSDVSEKRLNPQNQIIAILLFAFSILFFSVIILKGEHIWNIVHNFVWGVFGKASFLLPVLFIWISIATALDKPEYNINAKIWMSIVIIALFSSAFYIFTLNSNFTNINFLSGVKELYLLGVSGKGAGLFGGLFGIPFVYAFGELGARITVLVLLFVTLMFFTGTDLIKLFKMFTKPATAIINNTKFKEEKDFIDEEYEDNVYPEYIERTGQIDIPIGKMPEHPVKFEIPLEKKKEKNEKLEKLKRAFNIPIQETNEEVINREKKLNLKEMANELGTDEDNSAAKAAAAFVEKRKNSESMTDSKQKQPDPQTVPLSLNDVLDEMDVNTKKYVFPPTTLLEQSQKVNDGDIKNELELNGQMLVDTLKSFNVQTKIVDISRGPTVTRYELQPAAGVKISKITNLSDDIALNLAAAGVRIEAPIPGKAAVGIEIPNKVNSIVRMNELINSNVFTRSKSKLTVILGKDIAGNVTTADLSKMPHLLIAGSTGSGKSVCINSFIISLLYKSTPEEVKLLMIDPKVVELGIYNGIPHLLVPVVTDPRKAAGALNWAVNEMLKRYKIFADSNVRDLESYNRMVMKKLSQRKTDENNDERLELMPQIVIIIDELADLMMAAPNEVEDSICRLAQMARAAGMHLVIATQRPSVDVITGIIKANIPSRIALAVSSQIDSRTILDMSGAEKLLGRGDMLFSPVGSQKPIRIQGCYVTDKEIEDIISFIKRTQESGYDQNVIEEIEKNAIRESDKKSESDTKESTDPMMNEAIKCVVEAGQASTSLLQRRLRLGYARAGRLIDEMEQMGIIGPHEGSKPRQVIMTYQQWLERNMQTDEE